MLTTHIHQGGTLNTYCGLPTTLPKVVSWEQAKQATCPGCRRRFARLSEEHRIERAVGLR